MISEADFRRHIQATMDRIERAFSDVDPDVAECEQAQGAMAITFGDRSRCIVSAQPSVRQLWLALASRGTAVHFDWDEAKGEWIDDKGRGIELLRYLEEFFKEATGQAIRLQGGRDG